MSQEKKQSKAKLFIALGVIAIVFLVAKQTGALDYITNMDNVAEMQEYISSFGALGYIIFILGYTLMCLFALPGSVMTVLAGVAFGPVVGGIVALIGATAGATAAFLAAKYFMRDSISSMVPESMLKKIDDGVKANGTSFLILTRLVPVFPFNLQNFAYGLTDIGLGTYVMWSFICMAPGAFIFAFMAGEIVTNGLSPMLLVYLAIAGLVLFGISLIPKYIAKKKGIDMDALSK